MYQKQFVVTLLPQFDPNSKKSCDLSTFQRQELGSPNSDLLPGDNRVYPCLQIDYVERQKEDYP